MEEEAVVDAEEARGLGLAWGELGRIIIGVAGLRRDCRLGKMDQIV
jgi:hypothetical protein